MSYRYAEPKAHESKTLPAGEYDFVVVQVDSPYHNDKGNFVVPVRIGIKGTTIVVYDWPGAGKSGEGKPYDTVAPFLKSIRRNPAVGEEPDFSSNSLRGCRGTVKLKVDKDTGFNKVAFYVYDREQTGATISRPSAPPEMYRQQAAPSRPPAHEPGFDKNDPMAGLGKTTGPDGDEIPF
jgi:hypothetical protein